MKEREKILNPEFDRLIELAWKNQSHFGDLLLVHINGFYEASISKQNAHSGKKYNPHVIGPGPEGHSEFAHYSFINKYRTTNISKLNYSEYLKLHEYTPERSKEIDELVDLEETSIQLEMLVYLKFWEADMIIKKLYQFVRILNGEPYDWYFKVQGSLRDKNSSGSRQEIIRLKICDKLQNHSPIVCDLIRNTYKTQIRNSIAHSNYSFLGRNIHPNNFIEGDQFAQLRYITFDDWINIFHNTLVLHNQYIRMNNEINDFYAGIAKENGNEMEIRITEKSGKQYPVIVEYRPEYKEWNPKIYN